MVDLERHLVTIVGLGAPGDDEPGVVDEHVEAWAAVQDLLAGGTNRVEVGEIGEDRLGADLGGDGVGALGRSSDDVDFCAQVVQLSRCGFADPAAGSRDDDRLAGQVRIHRAEGTHPP